MFKLILHHTYKLAGEAVDTSHNENHGFRTAVPFLPDGISPGSGVLEFAGGPSRVRVTNKPVWQHLRALKIEAWVKLAALGQRRNLVEGDSSFAFFIHPDGLLWGTFLDSAHRTLPIPGYGPDWVGANSDSLYAPDHARHTVPLNTWTKLTYLHDGISSLRLYIDDALVGANYNIRAGLRSVGGLGVHIGHWPGDDRYTFQGQIDELKISKYDPDVPYKQFFCRPMDARQMNCWRQVFDNMAAMLSNGEQSRRLIGLMRCLSSAEEELVRASRSKGEVAIKRSDEFSVRYRELWCSGRIDGPEMKKLMRDWQRWLLTLLGRDYMIKFRYHTQRCWREYGGDAWFGAIAKHVADGDPRFAQYTKLLTKLWRPTLGL